MHRVLKQYLYKEAKPVKKEYEKPELILYGDLNELSGGSVSGV